MVVPAGRTVELAGGGRLPRREEPGDDDAYQADEATGDENNLKAVAGLADGEQRGAQYGADLPRGRGDAEARRPRGRREVLRRNQEGRDAHLRVEHHPEVVQHHQGPVNISRQGPQQPAAEPHRNSRAQEAQQLQMEARQAVHQDHAHGGADAGTDAHGQREDRVAVDLVANALVAVHAVDPVIDGAPERALAVHREVEDGPGEARSE
mmetsp:Transcript_97202/g.274962  ORF Transcript_97202/g.274962 Transcript_97202/m.274962 type:complete len:208 (+) Transcript_97202:102-725(+)